MLTLPLGGRSSAPVTEEIPRSPSEPPLADISQSENVVSADPPQLDFGDTAVGTSSAERSVTIRNAGPGPLKIDAARLIGPNWTSFSIGQDSCTGTTLPAGGQCGVGVTFVPAAPGFQTTGLILGDRFNLLTVPLTGTGSTTTTVPAQATLSRQPTSSPQSRPHSSAPPATVQAAGSNDRIAFNSGRDGNLEIYTMNPDGSGLARLTDHPANDWAPRWSPDKTRIVFYSNRTGNDEIYVMRADGTGLVQVTNNTATDSQPDWSPDGSRIVFTSTRGGEGSNLYVVNVDRTGLTRITSGPWLDVAPNWSPDGSRIAFASSRDGNFEIYAVNPNGSGATRLTNHPASDYDPSWSPDGRELAFWSERDGNGEIYVMNADASGLRRVTTNLLVTDGFVSWSPDGKRLVFESNRAGNPDIYVMPATGDLLGLSAQRITTYPAADSMPDW